MICPKCNHSWDYKGKSTYYLTCPHCYQKIRAPKLSPQPFTQPSTQISSQPSTQISTQPSTQELAQPIVDKAEIEKERGKYLKYYNATNVTCAPGAFCCADPEHLHLCSDCGITFTMMSAALSFCPHCGGKNVASIPEDELDRWYLCPDCDTVFFMKPFLVSFCPCCHSENIRVISIDEAHKRTRAMVAKYALTEDERKTALKKRLEYQDLLSKQRKEEAEKEEAIRKAAKQKAREERKAAQKAAKEAAKKTSKDADITYDRYEKINKLTEDQVHRIRNLYFTNEDDYVEIIEKEFGVSDEDAFDFAHVLVVNDLRDLYNDGTPIEDIAERLEIPEHKQDVIELVQYLAGEEYLKPRK